MSTCPICGQHCLAMRVLEKRGHLDRRELRAHAREIHKLAAWAGFRVSSVSEPADTA